MEFVIYDVIFLVLFVIFVSIFLYTRRKNLQKEGILFLYRTKWGMRLIDYVGGRYKKTLDALRYIIISLSYILMIGIIYLIIKTVYVYIWDSLFIEVIGKSPPLALVIPYFPKLFGLQDLFPPFYFVYFIIAIAIVAGVHEFSHGIFMKRYGIKIKSTGIAFLGPILGAFVEQDEEDMKKAKKIDQMTVLGAGVFANLICAIIFLFLLIGFFNLAFTPAGVMFDSYTYSKIEVTGITMVNEIQLINPSFEQVLEAANEEGFNKIQANGNNYFIGKKSLEIQEQNKGVLFAYDDAPAINVGLDKIISEVNNVNTNSIETLNSELGKYSPGDKITITTLVDAEENGQLTSKNYEIVLGENPGNKNKAYLGVGFASKEGYLPKHIRHFLASTMPQQLYVIDHVYHSPKINIDLSKFIYYLLWWIVMLNFLVALVNMVPAGIFDGGRFFYLTIVGITKKEKIGETVSKWITRVFLFILSLLMVIWIFRLF